MNERFAKEMLNKMGFRIEDLPVLSIEPSEDELAKSQVGRDYIIDAQEAGIRAKVQIRLEDGEDDET